MRLELFSFRSAVSDLFTVYKKDVEIYNIWTQLSVVVVSGKERERERDLTVVIHTICFALGDYA